MLILKNATITEFEPAQIREGTDIAIEGDKIAAVGNGLHSRYPGAEVKEMNGKLVMPELSAPTTTSIPVYHAASWRISRQARILSLP